jgi:glycosyltransferase involved in cell wall biosynthesis
MRLLHIIPVLWSGAGEVVTRLCERQSSRYDVAIATSAYNGSLRDWPAYRRRLRQAGVRHVVIDTFSREPHVFWASVDRLADLLRQWRPDVVHTHAGVPACALACAGRPDGVRHVAQMYSWGEGRPAWMNQMDLWGFRKADRVVCSARHYAALLRDAGVPARKLAMVRLGLAVDRIDAALAQRRSAPCDMRIGFVGRIEPRKGQLHLIKALSLVRRSIPDIHLDLVGPVADPVYAAECQDEAIRRGVAIHVTWRGYVRDVATILTGWRLFVSMSHDEGQGLAVQEAMAAGVPVLTRRASGVEDYVTHGRTGIVTRHTQAHKVAAAVVAALRQPALLSQIAANGSRLVRRNYTWERYEAAVDRVYRSAMRG